MKTEILGDFNNLSSTYNDFARNIENLISIILGDRGIRVHSISSRVKQADSLARKIDKDSGKYTQLSDITDISGVRVITYFEDEVDIVAQAIEEEFEIDWGNSIDKRKLLDPDRFGYLSLHYVISLSVDRKHLPEYRRYKDLKVEIQIRSILQHAWAEIEHDLGYKRKTSLPRDIRRNFSRLAGLLEIADQEFKQIRTSLESYEAQISAHINSAPEEVTIDRLSLSSYLKSSTLLASLNSEIASFASAARIYETSRIDDLVEQLDFFNIGTIAQLDQCLEDNKGEILKFAKHWINANDELPNSIAIFYLSYVLIGQKGDLELACEYVKVSNIDEPYHWDEISRDILRTYAEVAAEKEQIDKE